MFHPHKLKAKTQAVEYKLKRLYAHWLNFLIGKFTVKFKCRSRATVAIKFSILLKISPRGNKLNPAKAY